MPKQEGWQADKTARQTAYHYIKLNGFALCGGLGFYGGPLMSWDTDPASHCKNCSKRLPAYLRKQAQRPEF